MKKLCVFRGEYCQSLPEKLGERTNRRDLEGNNVKYSVLSDRKNTFQFYIQEMHSFIAHFIKAQTTLKCMNFSPRSKCILKDFEK